MKHLLLFIFSVLLGIVSVVFVLKPAVQKSAQGASNVSQLSSVFLLEKAPIQSLNGEITSMSGAIQFTSRIATAPAVLISPRPLQQGETIETGDEGSMTIEFKNKAKVVAAANTKLEFGQTLPEHIVVVHMEGSARYIIEKKITFSVRSRRILVSPAADSDITITKDEEVLIVDVVTGSITVAFNNPEFITKTDTISEGNRYIFNTDERSGVLEAIN